MARVCLGTPDPLEDLMRSDPEVWQTWTLYDRLAELQCTGAAGEQIQRAQEEADPLFGAGR